MDAPKDGTPILIKEGDYSTSVRWVAYPPDLALIAGCEGYWCYCDPLLADVAPQGPAPSFVWIYDPAGMSSL